MADYMYIYIHNKDNEKLHLFYDKYIYEHFLSTMQHEENEKKSDHID